MLLFLNGAEYLLLNVKFYGNFNLLIKHSVLGTRIFLFILYLS